MSTDFLHNDKFDTKQEYITYLSDRIYYITSNPPDTGGNKKKRRANKIPSLFFSLVFDDRPAILEVQPAIQVLI